MTNIEKAIALINSYADGNLEKDYIQYNLHVEKGKYAVIDFDGEYEVLHNLYPVAVVGGQIGIEISRYEDDKLLEHSQSGSVIEVTDLDKTDENKKLVASSFDENIKTLDALFISVDADNDIQHDQKTVDSVSRVTNVNKEQADTSNMTSYIIDFVYGKGNLVLVVSESSFYRENIFYYTLFRVQDSKIVEQWDVNINKLIK